MVVVTLLFATLYGNITTVFDSTKIEVQTMLVFRISGARVGPFVTWLYLNYRVAIKAMLSCDVLNRLYTCSVSSNQQYG